MNKRSAACGVGLNEKHLLTDCREHQNSRTKYQLSENIAVPLNNHSQSINTLIQFLNYSKLSLEKKN